MANDPSLRRANVAEYYGEKLQSSADLLTSACCPIDAVPEEQRAIVAKLHPEVVKRFYGCGSPIPDSLPGATVLDLGCGTGRDAFIASALVGCEGRVIGVDMTESQLEVARRHRDYHAAELLGDGVASNVEFREGIIEDLSAVDVTDGSVDVVISNCVCNLVSDKRRVWREVARVLAPGGELYFSDVYADRRLSARAASDPTLIAECLGGALYVEDFRRSMADAGFSDLRVVTCAPVIVNDAELLSLVPDVNFYSITARAFKVNELEDRRENYGQKATYKPSDGSSSLKLDLDFTFPAGVEVPVDSNTAAILEQSRYKKFFKVTERGQHYGLFDSETEGGILGSKLTVKEQGKAVATKAVKISFPDSSKNGNSEVMNERDEKSLPCCSSSGCC